MKQKFKIVNDKRKVLETIFDNATLYLLCSVISFFILDYIVVFDDGKVRPIFFISLFVVYYFIQFFPKIFKYSIMGEFSINHNEIIVFMNDTKNIYPFANIESLTIKYYGFCKWNESRLPKYFVEMRNEVIVATNDNKTINFLFVSKRKSDLIYLKYFIGIAKKKGCETYLHNYVEIREP